MKTLLVSGSDTDVGKTWVVATLAALLTGKGSKVQVVKPVETGVTCPEDSDIEQALRRCPPELASGFVLRSYCDPVAPAMAAERAGEALDWKELIEAIRYLPEADWRIIEGAGSLASPLDVSGADWADMALELNVDATVLVIPNRVGAIGQARMLYSYASQKGLHCGLWLNELQEQSSTAREGTLAGIRAAGIPVWAEQGVGETVAAIKGDWL